MDSRLRAYLGCLEKRVVDRGDAEAVRRFVDYCFSVGLSASRVYKYVYIICRFSRMVGKAFARLPAGMLSVTGAISVELDKRQQHNDNKHRVQRGNRELDSAR